MTSRTQFLRRLSAGVGVSAALAAGAVTVACGSSQDPEPTVSQISVAPVRETTSPPISVAPNQTPGSQNPPTGVMPGDQSTPRTPTGDIDPPGGPPGLPGGDSG